jgi:hypothetical protein
MAVELDRVALIGTGTAPEPRGVLNQSGVTLTDHGAAGTAITNYDWWLDAIGAVRAAGFEPNAHIQAPRSSTSLSKLKEATTNAYLTPPAGLLPMLTTKIVPINLTVGASTDTSLVFTGDWSNLLIGMRTDFNLRFLGERYLADSLTSWSASWTRMGTGRGRSSPGATASRPSWPSFPGRQLGRPPQAVTVSWWDRWVWSRVANREALTLEQLLATETTPTHAGVPVTTDHALRLTAVWACVRLLADAVSTLPLHVYRRGERDPLPELPPLLGQPAAGPASMSGCTRSWCRCCCAGTPMGSSPAGRARPSCRPRWSWPTPTASA